MSLEVRIEELEHRLAEIEEEGALIVARRFGADSKAFLRAAVLAEVAKWLLCAAICIAVFVGVKPLAAGWFFVGMGCVILAGWLGLILSS